VSVLLRKYVCIKQHDITDCGAACLATISKQYGFHTSITKIREVAGTDKQGTNAYGVIKAAEKLGFTAKGVKGDQEAFFSEFPLPCIAHVIVEGKLLHYVVIHKITKKSIIIADPGKGLTKLKPDEFFKIWTGVLILMAPAPAFEKGDETKGLFARFFGLLMPQRRLIMHIFFASLVFTALGILGSFYFKFLLDDILQYNLEKTLRVLRFKTAGNERKIISIKNKIWNSVIPPLNYSILMKSIRSSTKGKKNFWSSALLLQLSCMVTDQYL
jgi:ATP-binding cassette subfamily B protein